MADRRVKKTGKDSDGDITSLCGDGLWSPRSKAGVIRDINSSTHTYYVYDDYSNVRSNVIVYTSGGKQHLRTTSDSSSRNNLDNLPDC